MSETATGEILAQIQGLRAETVQVRQVLAEVALALQQQGPSLGFCIDCVIGGGAQVPLPALVWLAGTPLCFQHLQGALAAMRAGGGLVAAQGPIPPSGGLIVPGR